MAKMNDRVPKERLGTSNLNQVFSKSTRMTPPQNFSWKKKLALIQHSCKAKEKNLPLSAKYENVKLKIAQNLSYRIFLKNVGYKRDSPLQINCENFTMSCTVGCKRRGK